MYENIKVSIIMSTYNTKQEYLRNSINSILSQTHKNLEFIIVCDGSKEEKEFIEENFNDNRINLITHEHNEGLPKSLNEAIAIASGEYIARMDSDDISLNNRLEEQIKFMEKYKEIDICSMYAKCFGKTNVIKGSFLTKPKEIDIQLLYMNCIIHPTVMIRKCFLQKNNIKYNEEYLCSQDYELWSRIANTNISIIKKVGILYRIHEGQVSKEKSILQKKLREQVIINKLKNLNCINEQNIETFKVLAALNEITNTNFEQVSTYIDKFIETKGKIDRKIVKKVLYNRYFQICLNSKSIKLTKVIKNRKCRNKIINIINLKYIAFVILNRIKTYNFYFTKSNKIEEKNEK